MKAIITVSAPTTYQLSSIRSFKLDNFKSLKNGSHIAWQEFDSVTEAKKYLKDLAVDYYFGDKEGLKRNFDKNSLQLDACSASIEIGQDRLDYLESVLL